MSLKGKVAIVTGGGRGIGKEYCLALLNEGIKVCLCDVNECTFTEFIESLPENLQKEIFFKKCDVTNYSNFKGAFDKTMEEFGRIDIVINNAGIADEINWKNVVEVNFIGVLHGIQLAFQYMSLENGGKGGFVVNTSSIYGLKGLARCPVYSATKHAVVGLTKSYGADYHHKKTGIKVMAICPDKVDTYLTRNSASFCLASEEEKKKIVESCWIKLEELGKALLKILNDAINGSILTVELSGMQYV